MKKLVITCILVFALAMIFTNTSFAGIEDTTLTPKDFKSFQVGRTTYIVEAVYNYKENVYCVISCHRGWGFYRFNSEIGRFIYLDEDPTLETNIVNDGQRMVNWDFTVKKRKSNSGKQ